MAFEPSEYSYGASIDAGALATTLAPLAIEAGTTIATTAITGRRAPARKAPARKPAAPPPPRPSSAASASWFQPVAIGAGLLIVVGGGAFLLTRPKKAAA